MIRWLGLILVACATRLCVAFPGAHARRLRTTAVGLVEHIDAAACLVGIHPDLATFAISGAISGGTRSVARFLSYPLDTLKTLAQAESLVKEERELQRRAAAVAPRNPLDLFRGVVLAVVSGVPANSIFIVTFNTLNAFLPCLPASSPLSLLSLPAQQVLLSAIATVPQNLFKIPAELLKQRAQLSDTGERGESGAASILSVLQDAKQLGLSGLFQGGGAMMLREVPFNSIQMATFYYLREHAAGILPSADPAVQSGLLGLVAAGIAALATQPADTIKTRLMKTDGRDESIASMATKIVQASGIRGLYVGLSSRLALVSIGGVIYFATMALTGGELPSP